MTGKFYAKIWKEEPCQFLWEEKYMDAIDYKILKILQKNARETASNISKEIHLSVSAVIERIRKMEETGVIKEYTIIVDEKKTGNEMTALMEVSLEHPKFFDSFADAIQKLEYIVSCYYQTGDFDLIIRISCHSSDELEENPPPGDEPSGRRCDKNACSAEKCKKISIPPSADRTNKKPAQPESDTRACLKIIRKSFQARFGVSEKVRKERGKK